MSQGFSEKQKNEMTVTVEKALPFGVFVRIENGIQGYIRRREMSWDGDIDPRTLVKEGQKISAVILEDKGHSGKIELSHKLTLPDPWDVFTVQYKKGDVVEGCVKGILPNAIFAKILSGVDGYIPSPELATWQIDEPGEVFWIDDKVQAVITNIDTKKRRIRLSIKRHMERQNTSHSFREQLGIDEIVKPDGESSFPELYDADEDENIVKMTVDPMLVERIGNILVVEDLDVLRESFVQWLEGKGFQVHGAPDTETAIELVKHHQFGVCFVDFDLPGEDGVAFIHQLRQRGCDCHVIMMSSSEWLADRVEEIEEASVITVIFKPLDLNEISNLLNSIGSGEVEIIRLNDSVSPSENVDNRSFNNLTDIVERSNTFESRLRQGLEHVCDLTNAEKGIIFHIDPTSKSVTVKAHIGRQEWQEEKLYLLIDSPVKDVLSEKIPEFETNVSKDSKPRFQKLLDFLTFESCIGVPLGDGGQSDYALFIFHRRERAFNHYHLRDTQAVAALLGVALERRALERRIQAISSILLSGQLAAGFGHEVNNKISAAEIQIRNLQRICSDLTDETPPGDWHDTLSQSKNIQDGILSTVIDLKNTVHLFQRLAGGDRSQGIDVNQVLYQTKALLQPNLSKAKTRLIFELNPEVPCVPGSFIRWQQIFLNIMLNAVQHMSSANITERRLVIKTKLVDHDTDGRPLKVLISDTGTGIHKQLWTKIFDLGFSTRTDGTGLGLFIARSLAESMGGLVSVKHSYIPIGTTFSVECPILLGE